MKNYPVVRTDKMFGTDNRTGLYSVKYIVESTEGGQTVKTPTEITNGSVVKLGALVSTVTPAYTAREVYEANDVAADTALSEVVLIASPEVCYDERLRDLDDFTNEADTIARAYALTKGSIFSLTANAFDGTPAKGKLVELKAGHKFNAVTSITSGSTKVGVIDTVETAGKYTYYVVRVTG